MEITVSPSSEAEFTLFLRVPGWSGSNKVAVNGWPVEGTVNPGRYFAVRRRWQGGDRVSVSFDVSPRFTTANPQLGEDTGKVAVERGPLVYCLEALDQKGVSSLNGVSLPVRPELAKGFGEESRRDLLGGVRVLKYEGRISDGILSNALYAPLSWKPSRPIELTFIPYYAFANRDATHMIVWTPYFQA